MADCVRFLNPVLRGWGQYFRVGNSNRQFHLLDRYVTLRLARFDQDKRQRSYLGWATPWLIQRLARAGVYRVTGTVRYPSRVHATARSTSESRVRENRMPGSMGGGWKRATARHRASRLPYRQRRRTPANFREL